MTMLTPDTRTAHRSATGAGLGFAVLSAASFGLAGALASSLIDVGWSAGAVAVVRILGGVAVLALPAWLALRGRWWLVSRHLGFLGAYGVTAVAVAQLCFFQAVARVPVGVALLVEYVAPVAVVLWMWLRHGERPTRMTLLGGLVAAAGLVLLLDLSGGGLDPVGLLWSLAAMTGLACYFVLSAQERDGLPPVVLATGGLFVGGLLLLGAAALGLLSLTTTTTPVLLAGSRLPWWLPVALLGTVSAAAAYTTGIAAVRRLGARVASFVALLEVVAAVGFAWLLLAQLPAQVQLLGGLLILAGVVLVRRDEPASPASHAVPDPLPGHRGAATDR